MKDGTLAWPTVPPPHRHSSTPPGSSRAPPTHLKRGRVKLERFTETAKDENTPLQRLF